MSPDSTPPTLQELQQLRALHHLALQAVDQTYWAGGGPIYPDEVNRFYRTLTKAPWSSRSYDPRRTEKTVANLSQASLDDIRELFTHIGRTERFSTGAWGGILKGDVPLDAVFERLETLLLEPPQPPLNHPMAIAASQQAVVWGAFTLVALGLGLLVDFLRAAGHISRGETATPIYIVAVGFSLVALFCFIVSRRGQRALADIRRGDYLVHWRYGGPVSGVEAAEERKSKCRFLFFLLFIGGLLIGLVLGGIGAGVKGDFQVFLWSVISGLGIGALLGLIFAVPAWFLLGIRVKLAQELPSEVIFTRDGFYQPGRFIPVMSWRKERRKVSLLPPDQMWPCPRLSFVLWHEQYHNRTGVIHPQRVTARFDIPVPPGDREEAEANALARYYQG